MTIDELTEQVIGCAYKVHNTLRAGYLEKIYENSLVIELEERSLEVRQQEPLTVFYRGRAVGSFFTDLIVEDRLIIKIKAVIELQKEHKVQLVNYLNGTNIENGLLLNFGNSVEVKRKFKDYRK